MDLSIVIPFLNEEESIPELLDWIVKVVNEQGYRYEVILIDDGSTDGSWEKVQAYQAKNPNIKGIKFQRNYGKSAALHEGFKAAQGSYVITMDADLQDSPDEIPSLMQTIKEGKFDIVSGWKKKRYDNALTKNLPSKLYNYVTGKMSGVKLHDMNCGLKIYRKQVIKAIEVYGEMHRYIPVIAKWNGFKKIGEKPVVHQARKYGTSKFGWERFVNGFLDLATIMFVGKYSKRPMHFFGLWGSIVFFVGLMIWIYLAIMKFAFMQYKMTERPLFYLGIISIVIGAQLFLTGFLGELINRTSSERNTYLIQEKIGL